VKQMKKNDQLRKVVEMVHSRPLSLSPHTDGSPSDTEILKRSVSGDQVRDFDTNN
jgi:hypothetical protein